MTTDIERAFITKFSAEEARQVTDEVRRDATSLCLKLVDLHEGGAHLALGYSSWGAYCDKEFGLKRGMASYTLQAGRVIKALEGAEKLPVNVMQAGEMAPLLDRPDELRKAWGEIIEQDSKPRAIAVREAVRGNGKQEEAVVPEEQQGFNPIQSIHRAAVLTDLAFSVLDNDRQIPEEEIADTLARAGVAYRQWGSIISWLRTLP